MGSDQSSIVAREVVPGVPLLDASPNVELIPTPAMIIDMKVVEDNVHRMATYARQHDLHLRPHTKTHKLQSLGRMQMAYGASGLTVAKVGEAAVLSEVCDDLLIAYPALDPHRARRIAELARDKWVRVAVDSTVAVDALAHAAARAGTTVGILVDLDVGFHRTGVQSAAESITIAHHVTSSSHLRLDGLFCFPGHIKGSADQIVADLEKLEQLLQEVLGEWKRHGLEATIVSGGSTPSAMHSHHVPSLTEIRPGTYIFNDVHCLADGLCAPQQCAAVVIATVVSNAVPGKVVVDAGSKSLTPERHTVHAAWEGHGHVVGLPGARIVRVTEEHGEIDISACDRQPKLGERLRIIPVHVCPAVNLHEVVWLAHPDGWYEPVSVDARGKVC